MRSKVLVVGSMNYDIILKAGRLPEQGETMPVDGCTFAAGGKGANQAVQAAKLGVETYMVGCVGNDPMGDFLFNSAEKYGLHTEHIRRSEGPSGLGVVHALENGSVHASIVRGANFEITREDIDAVETLLDDTGLVILQMEIPLEINRYVIDRAKAHGCKVLLNAAPAEPFEKEYLQKCDILVVNEVEAAFYAGRTAGNLEEGCAMAKEMAAEYGNTVVITMGSEGAVVSDGSRAEAIPSMKVKAVETTGAGDSFIGGIAYSMINGMDIFEAGRFATKCSAVTVTRAGAQNSMPTLAEVTGQ
ncbi:MAG: ribokinase [Blautia sp.]|nr:ribokinase [Blautia sp.]